uniref:C2H2-type domain-containing protein n=1 Tax=Hucho hucho TaxID=62062 RepID=A0A4W5NG07_9TELE
DFPTTLLSNATHVPPLFLCQSADSEAASPGGSSLVKQERTEGEEDPRHSRDIQTGAASGAPPVATEDLAAQPRTRHSITEVLNSNDSARAQAQERGATSGGSKEKRFLCMFCNKGFSCLQKVEIHKRFHTGVKPFSCTQCHMRFAQAGDLKRHQRVHTGEKPFGCHLCRASFSHSSNLKRHLKLHTAERLYTLQEEVFREELPQDTPAEKAFTR